MTTNRNKLIVTALGAATIAISAGAAVALASDDSPAPRPAAQLGTSFTSFTSSSSSDSSLPSSTSETSSPTSPTTPSSSTAATAPGAVTITREQAARIAVAHAGGGAVTQVESEFEHGRLEWKIRVRNGGVRFDIRVDASTGAITRVDTDQRDDNNRGHGQDDPPSDDRSGSNSGHDDPPGDDPGGSNSGPGGGNDSSGRH